MKYSQDHINKIWHDAKNGKYDGVSSHHKPNILKDNGGELEISIPNGEGSNREIYNRKSETDPWVEVPFVGEESFT